jgi:hypothetical protein
MPLELQCRQCGAYYVPTKADVLSGVYRLCESCRKPPATSTKLISEGAPA